MSLLGNFGAMTRQYHSEISFGISALTLALAQPYINSVIRRLCRNLHWILRYAVFIVLCTAGYAYLGSVLYKTVKAWMIMLPDGRMLIWTVSAYMVLAWFTKREKAI